MSLSPYIEKDASNVWWLKWTADPTAIAYDAIIDGKHVQAGKSATDMKLGTTKPAALPQIAPGPVGVYETAVDKAAPPAFSVASSITPGATIKDSLTWEAKPSKESLKVEFYVDNILKWTENYAPYIFNGDGKFLDTKTLTNGAHTLKLVAISSTAERAELAIPVTVNNVVIPGPSPQPGKRAGRVNFFMNADSRSDSIVQQANTTHPEWQAWIKAHWQRGVIWSGWWDTYAKWDKTKTPYRDALVASYTRNDPAGNSPFIAKTSSGSKLKINYSGYDQWLADFSRQDFRDQVIKELKAERAKGYIGNYLDDVNLSPTTYDNGTVGTLPAGWSRDDWSRHYCEYLEYVRANVDGELVFNAVWYMGEPAHDGKGPYSQRMFKCCNYVVREFGFADGGIHPGNDEWSFSRLFTYMDSAHAAGCGVVALNTQDASQSMATFNLACMLLVSNGNDFVFSNGWSPIAYNPIFDTDLGEEKGPRQRTSTNPEIWRREFNKEGVDHYVEVNTSARTAKIV